MDLLTSLKISASGLAANKKRMEATSSNMANAQVTKTVEGGPYRRKEVVLGSEPSRESFADILEGELSEAAQEVHVTDVISSNRPPLLKYEPNHPHANKEGYVAYPDINMMEEMAEMVSASRNYEANISAMNVTKNMALKTLELGRN